MSVIYRMKAERSSLNDMFWFEPEPSGISFLPKKAKEYSKGIFDNMPGFNGYVIYPTISWNEIELRKNELRPDLKEYVDNVLHDATIDLTEMLGNPFELVSTIELNFDTIENFSDAYTKTFVEGEEAINFSNLLISFFTETNNTIVEEVLVDGVKIDYATRFN
jgi:hypothetical protein